MSYINQLQNKHATFCINPSNRTEQIIFNRIRDYQSGWRKINDTQREFRIGVETNCNGEICKNLENHQNTKNEIITFLKKNNIQKFSLETVDTDLEYSNKLQLDNDIYEELANKILETLP